MDQIRPPEIHRTKEQDAKEQDAEELSLEENLAIIKGEESYLNDKAYKLTIKIEKQLAIDPEVSPAILEELAFGTYKRLKYAAAKHPNTHPKVIDKLAESKDAWMLRALLENPKLESETIQKIYDCDEEKRLKYSMSKHPNTPEGILRYIAKTETANPPFYQITINICGNPNTPGDILKNFAKRYKKVEKILIKIASNPNTPKPLIFNTLANSDFDSVKAEAIKHPDAPPEMLLRLIKKPFCGPKLKDTIAHHPNVPPEALSLIGGIIGGNTLLSTRIAVAKNPKTPGKTLKIITGYYAYDHIEIQIAIAQNPNTPPKVLADLTRRLYGFTIVYKGRPFKEHHASEENLEARILIAGHQNANYEVLEDISHDHTLEVRLALASNKKTAEPLLFKIAKHDPRTSVKIAVAKNLGAERPTLAYLSEKTQPAEVRKTAMEHLKLLDT